MTATYDCIATTTLGSAAASVTFSSISGSFTDLVIVCNLGVTVADQHNVVFRFNSDTGNNYSYTRLYGDGSSAGSNRGSNEPFIYANEKSYPSGSAGENNYIINVMNYSNATTYKTTIGRGNRAATGTDAIVGLWRSTAAITSVTILCSPAGSYVAGSTFTLYGIKCE